MDLSNRSEDQLLHSLEGYWNGTKPSYSITPLIADILLLTLHERGGHAQQQENAKFGILRTLLHEACPGFPREGLSGYASGAAHKLVREGWVDRDFINPATGHRERGTWSIWLLKEPDAKTLERCKRSKARIIMDFCEPPIHVTDKDVAKFMDEPESVKLIAELGMLRVGPTPDDYFYVIEEVRDLLKGFREDCISGVFSP